MEEVFHFIHISDLHFQDSTVLEKLKQGGGLREITSKYPSIECLVVSGDLFHQGKLSKDAYDNLKSFLQSFSAKKIILVPGNHDLDRFVRQKKTADIMSIRLEEKRLMVLDKRSREIQTKRYL